MQYGLGPVHQRQCSYLFALLDKLCNRVDRSKAIADVGNGHQRRVACDEFLRMGEVKISAIGNVDGFDIRASALSQELPRHNVRVVFQLTDHDVLAGFYPLPDHLGDQVDALSGASGKDHLFAMGRVDEGLSLIATVFQQCSGFLS